MCSNFKKFSEKHSRNSHKFKFPMKSLTFSSLVCAPNFRKFKVALNPLRRFFFTFAKSCILSCSLQFDNKKWGSSTSFSSYKRLKLTLRVFLGHVVVMVTYCAIKLTATCLPMTSKFFDTMSLVSTDIEWL